MMPEKNENSVSSVAVALTIAGSDSGGGAGIQADLQTFAALDVFGTSALSCATAQNPSGVYGIEEFPPEFVVRQIKAVCDAFPVGAAKTGMLYSAGIIRSVAGEDVREGIPILVVDPVMVATSGARLLKADAEEALCNELLPQARVVTPNLHEAEILAGHAISSGDDMMAAAREIGRRYDVACVVKGGHLPGGEVVDALFDEGEERMFVAARVEGVETHGSGCAFSAALTALLARGLLLDESVRLAKDFVHAALEKAVTVGRHQALNLRAGGERVRAELIAGEV